MAIIIYAIILINLFLWFCTFFKTKKMVRTEVRGKTIFDVSYTPWEVDKERYKFPMWLFILGTIILLMPPLALVLYVGGSIGWLFFDKMFDDESETFKLERPRLLIQDFLNKKV